MIATPERMLDDILEGRTIMVEPAVSPLVEIATLLEGALRPPAPPMGQARALFAGGVAARKPGLTWRHIAVPAMAMLALVIAAGSMASRALPGDALYPVRRVLGAVGLTAPSTIAIDGHIVAAARLVEMAEDDLTAGDPGKATDNARRALQELDSAAALLADLDEEQRAVREIAISSLEQRAIAIISAQTGSQPGTTREETDGASNRDGKGHEGSSDDEGVGNEGSSSDEEGSGSDDGGDDGVDNSATGSGGGNDQEDADESKADEPDADKPDADEVDPDDIDEMDVVEEAND